MPQADYFSAEAARHDLKRKTVRGGVSIAIAQSLNAGIQLVSIPILSRLLAPEDFGVVAMAVVFTGFGQLLIDAGFAQSTVQRDDLTEQQSSNLFWLGGLAGLTLTLVMLAIAGMLTWAGRPELGAVTAVLSAMFVLAGFTIQHQALLRRTLRFRSLAAVRVGSAAAAQSVAIAVALTWPSYWALVAGQLVQAFVAMVATCTLCGWVPGRPSGGAGTRSMVEFGVNLTAARLINYASRSTDRALIGFGLGADVLGFYDRAYKSLLYPIQNLNTPVGSLMVPALSRLVSEPSKYRLAFATALRGVAALGLPLVAFAAIDSERLVLILLGAQWGPSVPIFQALLPVAAIGTLQPTQSWAFLSTGRGVALLRWQSLVGVATVTGVVAGLSFGALGVAWGFSLARIVTFPVGLRMALRDTAMTLDRWWAAVAPVVGCVALSAGPTLALQFFGPDWVREHSFGGLAVSAAFMFSTYVVAAIATGLPRSLWSIVRPAKRGAAETPSQVATIDS